MTLWEGRPTGRPSQCSAKYLEVYMNLKKTIRILVLMGVMALLFAVPAFATGSTDDVASVVEETWQDAAEQIKDVVDGVVFPALDMILAIAFFGKLALSYFDYRRHGQFEWTGPIILFACLVLTMTAPAYIWNIVGI